MTDVKLVDFPGNTSSKVVNCHQLIETYNEEIEKCNKKLLEVEIEKEEIKNKISTVNL